MRVVVSGASGFIGGAVVQALSARGDRVTALTRFPERARFETGVQVAPFDPAGPPDPTPFEGADAVIHLAGESVAGRWTDQKKRAIHESRVAGTRVLVDSIAACVSKPKTLVAASGAGYYGDRADEPLLEDGTPGEDFLAHVCVDWEREVRRAQTLGMRTASLRQGIVLGRGGGALHEMLPPFRLFAGGPYGNGSQWMPWIHLDDAVALYLFALDRDLEGPINAVSPDIATSARLAHAIGHAVRRPALAPAPGVALYAALGGFASTLLASALIVPDRALAAGFVFQHEILDDALLEIISPDTKRRAATQVFEDAIVVKAPLEKAFTYLSDAGNLASITPPRVDLHMKTPAPVKMRRGAVIDYSIKAGGLRTKWKSLIMDWRPGERFTDYQVRGPYELWRHDHFFSTVPAGTLVRDRVTYSLPLAPLSGLALPIVRAELRKIFEYRRAAAARLLG